MRVKGLMISSGKTVCGEQIESLRAMLIDFRYEAIGTTMTLNSEQVEKTTKFRKKLNWA